MRKFAVLGGGLVAALGALLALRSGAAASDGAGSPGPVGGGPAVVLELFSSEGCSSCPPADAYLSELDRTQPVKGVTVIALEEHVDYWNDLGWADPFSQPQFSARQRQYAAAIGDRRVYTPELLVDGHTPTDRGQAQEDLQAAAREPKAHVDLERRGNRLGVIVRDVPRVAEDDPAEAWLAVTESHLTTHVERGENAGRTLAHGPVVRRLERIGRVDAEPSQLEVALDAGSSPATRAVVFVQRAKSKRILGAAAIAAK
ncbi:MAG TPA: DUF1223 domain-containing protein [Polyangiaceae bacterium]|nr:DUF1223 domain-containing protein [Polyangiaceae bacterium]